MQQVLDSMLQTNVALMEKMSLGIVSFEVNFIAQDELIGLNTLGKWKRILVK